MYDILIKNGQIVDGSGAPVFFGDVVTRDGKIARIAPVIDETAEEVIDTFGLQVTPGCGEPAPPAGTGTRLPDAHHGGIHPQCDL